LRQEETRKDSLARQVENLEKELDSIRGKTVKIADTVRQNESDMRDAEAEIAKLQEEKDTIQKRLEGEYGSMANVLLALERLRRVPPEALIVRPNAPLQTAQTAMVMQSVLPVLNARAEALAADLARLDTLTKDLTDKREKAAKNLEVLKSEQDKISSLTKERQKLFHDTQDDYGEAKQTAQRLAAQAKSLQDLMKKLERERRAREQAESETVKQPEKKKNRNRATPLPQAGQPRLPVGGIIKTAYGEKDDIGATSRGLRIESRSGSLVVAPMGGVVRFVGQFQNYGQMVIIEHKGEYHSLIAGLGRIDAAVGQKVSSGEPVGVLSSSSRGVSPTLYFELRHNGEPINPAKKFGGLKS
jgi:septal ring factor EnvC (AmiA/AmiB activator)